MSGERTFVSQADAIVEGYQRRAGQPGIAYGIVHGGRLVHAGLVLALVTGAGHPNRLRVDRVFERARMDWEALPAQAPSMTRLPPSW